MPTDDISLMSNEAVKGALRESFHLLPSRSDRRFAESLATYSAPLTDKQVWHARELLRRARIFAASGDKRSTDDDIFGTGNTAAPRVPAGVHIAGVRVIEHVVNAAGAVSPVSAVDTTPPSTASAPNADQLEAIVRRVLEPGLANVAKQVDERAQQRQDTFNRVAAKSIAEQCVTRVLDEMEKRKPREVRVSVVREGATRTIEGATHKQFEHLVKVASLRLANGYAPGIFLAGEAGSGKTTGAKMLAEVLGLPWHFNGAISFPHEMLGFIDAAGHYHRTPFREAYEHGGVYTFDEVDRSDPVALLGVNPHLANGIATFPDGQVKRHSDCIIVATANTWGHGADAQYSGATKLDAAFLSRFPVRIAWDIDPGLEEALVGPGAWLNRVRAAREKAQAAGLKIMIDTRHAIAGAALISLGYSLNEASEMTYLAGLKSDQRNLLT